MSKVAKQAQSCAACLLCIASEPSRLKPPVGVLAARFGAGLDAWVEPGGWWRTSSSLSACRSADTLVCRTRNSDPNLLVKEVHDLHNTSGKVPFGGDPSCLSDFKVEIVNP